MEKKILSALVLLLVISCGCRDVVEITTYSQIHQYRDKEIEVVTADSFVYKGKIIDINDSSVVIKGTKIKEFKEEIFTGRHLFKDIVYIQSGDEEVLTVILKLGITAVCAGYIMGGFDKVGTITETRYAWPEGEPSCPFVYSWDGEEFFFEGETFGTSLGRALENETAVVLKEARADNGVIKLRYTNERPETHFFNTIRMYAVETLEDADVFADNRNNITAVDRISRISSAKDDKGRDITGLLLSEDDSYWTSDLSSANIISGFEDVIYIGFNTDGVTGDSVSLMFSVVNSELSMTVFELIGSRLQQDYIHFMRACETDPELIATLEDILERSAMKIDILTGNDWVFSDIIYPEASAIDFRKLVKLPANKGEMVVRLRMLSGLWKINSVAHGSHIPDIIITELQTSNEVSSELKSKDEEYLMLLPGEMIDLEYMEVKPSPGKKITYVTRAGGYLYEFVMDAGRVVENMNPDFPRLKEIKELIKNERFLVEVYSKLKIEKN